MFTFDCCTQDNCILNLNIIDKQYSINTYCVTKCIRFSVVKLIYYGKCLNPTKKIIFEYRNVLKVFKYTFKGRKTFG